MISHRATLTFALFLSLVAGPIGVRAQESILVNLDNLEPRELQSAAFELSATTDLTIEAVGADERMRGSYRGNSWNFETDYWRGNAWILDAASREVVWELSEADTDRRRGGYEEFAGSVRLPAGRYIAYYSSYSGFYSSDDGWFTSGRRRARYDDGGVSEEFMLTLRGEGQAIPMEEVRDRADHDLAFVSFRDMEYDQEERIGFRLERPTEIAIYALGEATRESTYDYAWILNGDTREVVWRFDYWTSDRAGGAVKNRVADETVTLPAGNYVAIYVTDDSHDAFEWNAAPPHDPEYWGLTLAVTDRSDLNRIATFEYQDLPRDNVVVELTRLGDDESVNQGFTLSRGMTVRVHAVGEGTRSQMYDYGWIINATTREVVWRMDYRDTEHAGGDDRNRLADEELRLDAGSYIVHFVTDGSHSYRDWNGGTPIDGESWGITVLGVGDFDPRAVSEYDDDDNPAIIARIVDIRDYDNERERFTLDTETRIRIYAIGEGTGRNSMYDYAWIENDRGRTVWEMSYRMTDWAGGARKNRMVNEIVTLPAGSYTLHYESDGSHSFNDWNDDPPSDPGSYGVTLFRTD